MSSSRRHSLHGTVSGGGRRVLVVDDEAPLLALMENVLTMVGFQVFVAASGETAVQVVRGGPQLDLLICDQHLGDGFTGEDVARAARERWPGLPVIRISGYAIHDPDRSGILEKPFNLTTLLGRVAAALGDAAGGVGRS